MNYNEIPTTKGWQVEDTLVEELLEVDANDGTGNVPLVWSALTSGTNLEKGSTNEASGDALELRTVCSFTIV